MIANIQINALNINRVALILLTINVQNRICLLFYNLKDRSFFATCYLNKI
jgi:hypothetical protein